MLLNTSVKYKLMSQEELAINLDRLTRFKLPEYTYNRVFCSILLKYLIYPKYSKKDIELLPAKYIAKVVKEIWNKSVENIYGKAEKLNIPYKAYKLIINKTYTNIDERTKTFINAGLKFTEILSGLSFEKSPLNIKMLIKVNDEIKTEAFIYQDLIDLRKKYSLQFPISRLIIVEGITEEILLPVFADKLGYNFSKCGIYILGAGGKSKSPNLYALMRNKLKIPVTILFDADANDINEVLQSNLQKKDKSVVIKKGEFEDILSLNLIKRTLNNEFEVAVPVTKSELSDFDRMCRNIENFYRTRHLGEFKKSKFSKIIAKNIKYETDITSEIRNLLELML